MPTAVPSTAGGWCCTTAHRAPVRGGAPPPDRAAIDEGRWRTGALPLGLWIGWALVLLFAVVGFGWWFWQLTRHL